MSQPSWTPSVPALRVKSMSSCGPGGPIGLLFGLSLQPCFHHAGYRSQSITWALWSLNPLLLLQLLPRARKPSPCPPPSTIYCNHLCIRLSPPLNCHLYEDKYRVISCCIPSTKHSAWQQKVLSKYHRKNEQRNMTSFISVVVTDPRAPERSRFLQVTLPQHSLKY